MVLSLFFVLVSGTCPHVPYFPADVDICRLQNYEHGNSPQQDCGAPLLLVFVVYYFLDCLWNDFIITKMFDKIINEKINYSVYTNFTTK